MGLKQELLGLAEQLKKDAAAAAHDVARLQDLLLEAAAELRGVARALPDDGPGVWSGAHPMGQLALSNDRLLKERVMAQDAKRRAHFEEANSCVMRACVGGPADDTTAQTHPDMPVGASCVVAGCVYRLGDDGSLHAVAKAGGA